MKKPLTESAIIEEHIKGVESILLEKIARDIYPNGLFGKKVTPELMKLGVLHAALANWHLLAPVYCAQLKYANAEGLSLVDYWRRLQERQIFRREKKSRKK